MPVPSSILRAYREPVIAVIIIVAIAVGGGAVVVVMVVEVVIKTVVAILEVVVKVVDHGNRSCSAGGGINVNRITVVLVVIE